MELVSPSSIAHLLRAVHDPRVTDAEIDRRIASKNAVVARALQQGHTSIEAAQSLLYDFDLWNAVASARPGCVTAVRILEYGCTLPSIEDRLPKWSGELDRVLGERLAGLLLWSQVVLSPDRLVDALRRRPTLSPLDAELAAVLVTAKGDWMHALLPVFLRTLTADLDPWPRALRCELEIRILELLPAAGETTIDHWRAWWRTTGVDRYPDPIDVVPEQPITPEVPVRLWPEGGGEYTLDPPPPIAYWGRPAGRLERVGLRPRSAPSRPWRVTFSRIVSRVLDGGEPAGAEYHGLCALDGWRSHVTAAGEALLLSIPDPETAIAWLACSQCGQSGYVRFEIDPGSID